MEDRDRKRMLLTCLVVICGVSCVVGPAVLMAAGVFFWSFSDEGGPVARPILPVAGAGERRTAVVIAIDDLRRDHLAPYGYERDPAPALTELAERGEVVRDYLPATVATSPALATLLTELSPWEHGLASARELGAHKLPRAVETLPEALRDAGWRTFGAVSRPHLAARLSGLDQGFEEWRETFAPAAEVLSSLAPDLGAELAGDADVFLFLHFGDLTEEGRRTDLLREYLEPFRAADAGVDEALRSLDVLTGLEQAVGRQRGSAAWLALKSALYDAAIAEVDEAVGEVLGLLDDTGRADAIFVVVGTRGRFFDEFRPPEGAPEEFSPTLLGAPAFTAGLPVPDAIGTADLSELLRVELLGGVAVPDADPIVAGPALRRVAHREFDSTLVLPPGWGECRRFYRDVEMGLPDADLTVYLPQGLRGGLRLDVRDQRSGDAALPQQGRAARDWAPHLEPVESPLRLSPSGASLEGEAAADTEVFAGTATRTAVLALDVTVGGDTTGWTTTLPVFPSKRDDASATRLRVTRDGAWALVTCDAAAGEEVRVVARGYPLEPFAQALEVEEVAGAVKSLAGLDTVVATSTGSMEFRVRLRARQTLALEATLDGEAVPWSDMSSELGEGPGTLTVYLSSASEEGEIVHEPSGTKLTLRREYPGLVLREPFELTDADLRLLSRLGPNE